MYDWNEQDKRTSANMRYRLGYENKISQAGGVSCFMPKGRSSFFIYAVRLVDHKGAVKIGRTIKWTQRRRAYSDWNLRLGDGIAEERVFRITEEFVDLAAVEAAILDAARSRYAPYRGLEWFLAGDIDDVCRLIDEVLCAGNLSYSFE